MRDLHESQRFLQGIRDYSPNAIVIKSLEAVLDPCDLRARASPRRREPFVRLGTLAGWAWAVTVSIFRAGCRFPVSRDRRALLESALAGRR
jgi:hypothetical protein